MSCDTESCDESVESKSLTRRCGGRLLMVCRALVAAGRAIVSRENGRESATGRHAEASAPMCGFQGVDWACNVRRPKAKIKHRNLYVGSY